MADDGVTSSLGGLMRLADPELLISVGAGLMAGAKYGSNAGEGLLQGLQMYQGMKSSALQRQLMGQQIQSGNLQNQRQQMMLKAAQQALGGDPTQGGGMPAGSTPAGPVPGQQAPFLPGISQMPPAAENVSTPPTVPQQGGSSALTPPSMDQIYNTAWPGGGSPAYNRAMAMFSQDPAAALLKAREDQLKMAQQNYAPTIAKLDTLIKSDAPSKYMKADQQLMGAWPQLAQSIGLDPEKDYNDHNVRMALTAARNQMAGSLQEPTMAPETQWRTEAGPLGSQYQVNPVTGERKQIKSEEPLKDVLVNGQPTAVRTSQAEGKQPFNQVTYGTAQMSGGPGALLAALATKGVSLPAGLRSQQQQIATLNGLIAANPGKSPDEIADLVRTGQLDFNGAKRSTGQLSVLSAAADVQSRKIEKDLASLGPIVQKLPGGPAKVTNWLTRLSADWSWNGDKESTEAIGYIKEIAGEYAKLVSGSTGQSAPAEGEMKSAVGLMQSALSKNGYEGMHDFLLQTSQNRRDSVREGLQNAAAPGTSVGQRPGVVGGAPVSLAPGQSHSVGGFTVTRVK